MLNCACIHLLLFSSKFPFNIDYSWIHCTMLYLFGLNFLFLLAVRLFNSRGKIPSFVHRKSFSVSFAVQFSVLYNSWGGGGEGRSQWALAQTIPPFPHKKGLRVNFWVQNPFCVCVNLTPPPQKKSLKFALAVDIEMRCIQYSHNNWFIAMGM